MRILNLFADADGESHFREIDVECTEETPWGLKLSKRLPAAAILFVEGTSTNASVLQSPHPTPCRQYVIWLDAEYELTASDGEGCTRARSACSRVAAIPRLCSWSNGHSSRWLGFSGSTPAARSACSMRCSTGRSP